MTDSKLEFLVSKNVFLDPVVVQKPFQNIMLRIIQPFYPL